MGFRAARLCGEHRSQVPLGGCIAPRPKNFCQAKAGIRIVRPAAKDCDQHSLGLTPVALVPSIERRLKLRRVAMLFERSNRIDSPILAIGGDGRGPNLVAPPGTA